MNAPQRLAFIKWLLDQRDKPYLWGGKHGDPGYDCSGLVTAGYFVLGLPDWRETHSAKGLFDALPKTDWPRAGDVCFYGHPTKHVMVYWGNGRIYGAHGGDSSTTTLEEAIRRGAKVSFVPDVYYRLDFTGYGASPFKDA